MKKIRRVLVANRGEIAVRIIRACFDEGIESVLVVSDADIDSQAARLANRTVRIGPASPSASYLDVSRIVSAAIVTGCDSIHPGYGFLSERAALATACEENGITFIGPSVDSLERGGDKLLARQLAQELGIPISSGSGPIADVEQAFEVVKRVGLPILIKAAAGGGGRGMGLVYEATELQSSLERASSEAREAFGDGRLFIERFVTRARHVEVQVLGDKHGNVVHLGERDCSIQRRYQKLVEEAPAFGLAPAMRKNLYESAVKFARALNYVGAGTVEFLVDVEREEFYFLEMNTRVQVEHPVTEMVTGIDIVRQQIRIAAGERFSFKQSDVKMDGHAIEFRITAEDVSHGFRPTPGTISVWAIPQGEGVRVDTHCYPGYQVSPFYDSLLAKIIVKGKDRATALEKAMRVLAGAKVEGVPTTLDFHQRVVSNPQFQAGNVFTRWVETSLLAAVSA